MVVVRVFSFLGLVGVCLWLLLCALAHAERLWRWRKSQR
jgi:hypothetical protein